jgi:hypothetical protein
MQLALDVMVLVAAGFDYEPRPGVLHLQDSRLH